MARPASTEFLGSERGAGPSLAVRRPRPTHAGSRLRSRPALPRRKLDPRRGLGSGKLPAPAAGPARARASKPGLPPTRHRRRPQLHPAERFPCRIAARQPRRRDRPRVRRLPVAPSPGVCTSCARPARSRLDSSCLDTAGLDAPALVAAGPRFAQLDSPGLVPAGRDSISPAKRPARRRSQRSRPPDISAHPAHDRASRPPASRRNRGQHSRADQVRLPAPGRPLASR